MYLAALPIPEATSLVRDIEAVAQRLVTMRGQGPEVPDFEDQLNALVYEAYGLTPEEIALIEDERARP